MIFKEKKSEFNKKLNFKKTSKISPKSQFL